MTVITKRIGRLAARWAPSGSRLHDADVQRVAQVIVVTRIMVVLSIGGLVLFGGGRYDDHAGPVAIVLAVALGYSLLMLGREKFEMRYQRTAWLVTASDLCLAFLLLCLTGGIGSPVVAVFLLVVVVAALRHPPVGALLTAALMAASLILVAVVGDRTEVTFDVQVLIVWWPLFLMITMVLTTALSALVEREHTSRLRANLEAETEHAAAEEERDLRQRLLDAYQSQQDGLRVILHEFRTPVLSLSGLTEALFDTERPLSSEEAAATARITRDHIRHLDDMLSALGDVAISWRPAFASGRVREVDLGELAAASGNAAGVDEERLRVRAEAGGVVLVDAQAVTRIVTNLVENAARHSGSALVELELRTEDRDLVIRVLDRGPGVPASVHGELSRMYTSVGNKHGTAGLGLWIVQQIVDASRGRLTFTNRVGGGLMVTVILPLVRPVLGH